MDKKEFKTAIVGCGNIAKVHTDCLKQMNHVKITAVCDIDKNRADNMAEDCKAVSYISIEEMLEKEKPDIVHICTPHNLHVPMAILALKHDCYVFMEKPPVISKEQLTELSSAPKIERLGICFQNRYNPAVKYVKGLLDSGKPGKILGARGFVTWSRDALYYTESGWRGILAKEGGGALMNQSVHTLDLIIHFLGRPEMVEACMKNHHLKGVIEVEDMMEVYLSFPSAQAVFYATTAYCENLPPVIDISCENMTIRLEASDVTLYYRDSRIDRIHLPDQIAYGKKYWGSSHGECIERFYEAIEMERKIPLSLPQVQDTVDSMLAIYESAGNGSMTVTL